MSDVENGDEDPMLRIIAAEHVANGTAPKWERPTDPVHWTCDGCGVEVITNLDACVQDGSKATTALEYHVPFKSKASDWYSSHPFDRHGDPEDKPAHTFEHGAKVCEFCLEHCTECGCALSATLELETYDEGNAIQSPASSSYYNPDYVCEDCLSKVEDDEAQRVWLDCYSTEKRIAYMRKHASQFDCLYTPREPSKPETCAHFVERWRDILANARGRYFSGDASELIAP